MSIRRAVTIAASVGILLGILGAPPALAFTETASNNFFGTFAGQNNSCSCAGSFFGAYAGQANSTGMNNSFFGTEAGKANTSGSENSFFGRSAGYYNSTGFNSFANTTGSVNAFLGYGTGAANTTGSFNTFLGGGAGFNNTTGALNAFFGRDAGLANTTENNNAFIGPLTNGFGGITNATALGYRAQVSGSNALVLGSVNGVNGATSNVNVGMGTTTPDEPLHVRRGNGTAKVLVEEASGTTLGRELFQLVNNGAARFRLTNTNNAVSWDFQTSGGAGSFVIDRVGGPVSVDMEVQPDGDLVMRGSVTGTSFITSSDRNLKTDITPVNARRLMSMVRDPDISTWRFKNEPEGTVNLGPMAQDFHRLFGMGTDTTIDVRDLAALAVVAAQALDDQNADQEKEIVALKTAVAELSRR